MKEQVLQVTKGDFVGSARSGSINSINRILSSVLV